MLWQKTRHMSVQNSCRRQNNLAVDRPSSRELHKMLLTAVERLGYCWPKMIPNTIAYATRYHACQVHVDFICQATGHLQPSSSSWPFKIWGIDVIRPISPPTSKRHRFILPITDYFSKLVKVALLREVKPFTWSSSSNITYYTALTYLDESSTIMGPIYRQTFQKFYNKFRIQSVSSRYTTQLPTVLQRPSTRPLKNFSRSLSQKINWTGMRS